MGEQKPLGRSPLRGNPSPESTYLPTFGQSGTKHGPGTGASWAAQKVHKVPMDWILRGEPATPESNLWSIRGSVKGYQGDRGRRN